MTSPAFLGAVMASIYLLGLMVWDFRVKENPWYLTTPVIICILLYRILTGSVGEILLPWGLLTLPLLLNFYGAADYRLLLILFGCFPTWTFTTTLGVGMFALSFPLVLWKAWRRRHPDPEAPGRADLLARGAPGIFVIALPAIVYIWFIIPLELT